MKYVVNGKPVTLEEFLSADVRNRLVFGRSCVESISNKKGDVIALIIPPVDEWPDEEIVTKE